MTYEIIEGDCLDVMAGMADASVDAVITDPPYELGFMGKSWDCTGVAFNPATWAEALRVAKPGSHLLAFGGTRTFHRIAVAIEDAGWEIRDTISWLYGSGFPKSLDVSKAIDKAAGAEREVIGTYDSRGMYDGNSRSGNVNTAGDFMHTVNSVKTSTAPATDAAKQWQGWGTSLKPAFEPIIVARKPFAGTVAANVQRYGTGAINVDACRIGTDGGGWNGLGNTHDESQWRLNNPDGVQRSSGRWPANVMLDEESGRLLDEMSGPRPVSGSAKNGRPATGDQYNRTQNVYGGGIGARQGTLYNDSGGASRFFYCAKASTAERGEGNVHPTVKPLKLMAYLCRLVTPPGGTVLDPFMGSGSTGVAALMEGFDFIGIERESNYAAIARARLTDAAAQPRLSGVA